MKCPFCSNRLRQAKTKSAMLDFCPNCKGVWFDAGEFGDFVGILAESEKISPEQTKLFQRREVGTVYKLEEKERFCPKCNTKLKKFNYCGDSNVFLDRCLNCGGIWADGGEVEQVARYIKEDPRATAVGKILAETTDVIKQEQEVSLETAKTYTQFFLFFPRVIVPLGSDSPKERIPIVTISIMILFVLFFISRVLFDPNTLREILKFIPEKDFRDIDLFSSMFLIGSHLHLIWDFVFLWLFGNSVEDRFSRLGYLVFFMFCGIFSSFLYCIYNWNLLVVTVGISGSVAGVIGAYFIFYPMARIRIFAIYKTFEVPAVICLSAWFLFHLVGPLLTIAEGVPKTAWIVPILGFLGGSVVALIKKDSSDSKRQ